MSRMGTSQTRGLRLTRDGTSSRGARPIGWIDVAHAGVRMSEGEATHDVAQVAGHAGEVLDGVSGLIDRT